jgi:hypothetical protein
MLKHDCDAGVIQSSQFHTASATRGKFGTELD